MDLKPIPLTHGHRVHGLSLPEATVGVGPLGAFGGYVLMPVMNEQGLFFRWVQGVKTPQGREGGGDRVERLDGEGQELD